MWKYMLVVCVFVFSRFTVTVTVTVTATAATTAAAGFPICFSLLKLDVNLFFDEKHNSPNRLKTDFYEDEAT